MRLGFDLDLAFGEEFTGATVERYNQRLTEVMKFKNAEGSEYLNYKYAVMDIERGTYGKMPVQLEEIDQEFAKRIIDMAENGAQNIIDALAGLLPEAEINSTIDRLKSLAKVLKPLIGKEDGPVITESKK